MMNIKLLVAFAATLALFSMQSAKADLVGPAPMGGGEGAIGGGGGSGGGSTSNSNGSGHHGSGAAGAIIVQQSSAVLCVGAIVERMRRKNMRKRNHCNGITAEQARNAFTQCFSIAIIFPTKNEPCQLYVKSSEEIAGFGNGPDIACSHYPEKVRAKLGYCNQFVRRKYRIKKLW